MVNLPDFHDGYLDGILVSGRSARLFLRTVDGPLFTLLLHQVEALRADDFRQGNIIFEVNLLNLGQINESFVFQLYDYGDYHKDKFVLADWKTQATQKGLSGLEITTSYGCELWSIFAAHEFLEGHVFPRPTPPLTAP
jgi:hypothetical protein